VAFSTPCPNDGCGYLIYKDGGCRHVQCSICRHEFCWECLGSYQGYRHSEFDNGSVCGVRILVAAVVALIGAFALLLKLLVEINNAVFSSNTPLTSNQQPTIAGVIGSGISPIFDQIWNAIKLFLAYIIAKFVNKQFTPWNLK